MAKTANNVEPVIYFHPGEFLKEKIQEMELTEGEFSKLCGISENKIKLICACKADVDEPTALALEKATTIPVYMWLKFQESFNIYKLQKLADMLLKNLKRNETSYEVKQQKVRQAINKMAAFV